MFRSSIYDTGVLTSDETFRLESRRLVPFESTGILTSYSDIVLLNFAGSCRITTGDRVHDLPTASQAFVNAGNGFEITANDLPLSYLIITCPGSEISPRTVHDQRAISGGVTVLRTDRYDRFPDSGLVRGGMFFLDEGKITAYHSHDGASEVFVFLRGECTAKVEGISESFSVGDMLYVPAEEKHELANVGKGRLEVWLTVTPNVRPSHTFYDEQADGSWVRNTPRLDGESSRPPGR